MELWTEYEGRTIDGDFPLTKLLRPEGRSAFFSTSNGTGTPTVIRLIESHFDDDEILARWRGVEALNHANLVKLKKFGQVTVDETPLVYAVMEPVEANLGEIVSQGRLSVAETRELANSLVSALEALHANGFVHEHVEPSNVLAVGEVVKLRSDCIREAPEGEEGRALKRRDVHDFAVVVLQAMTQYKTLEGAARDLPLAAPFDQMVRKGMNGEWGLKEISAALQSSEPVKRVATPATPAKAAAPVKPVAAAAPVSSGKEAGATAAGAGGAAAVVASASPSGNKVFEMAPAANRVRVPVEADRSGTSRGLGVKIGIAVAALVLLMVVWHMVSVHKAQESAAPQTGAAAAPVLDNGTVQRPAPVVTEEASSSAAAPASPRDSAAVPGNQWRVVAFTYNHQDQAQHKAETVAQEHPDLKAEVFTPNGRAPYLVTLGGAMSKQDAFALSGKAKREGLPRDVYAQNYRSR
jgi:eukaryotic-like serine/threonine-protein kinase